MTNERRKLIKRLNVLLRLATVGPYSITDRKLRDLLAEIYLAAYDYWDDSFVYEDELAEDREMLKRVQQTLQKELTIIKAGTPSDDVAAVFNLGDLTAFLFLSKDGGFEPEFIDGHLETHIYLSLILLLKAAKVGPKDLLTCSRKKCRTFFIPLRRPSDGENCYCSDRCRSVISSRKYRASNARVDREKEASRSRSRYAKNVHKKFPNAPIKNKAKNAASGAAL